MLWWNTIPQQWLPVVGGRRKSTEVDWKANKSMHLINLVGWARVRRLYSMTVLKQSFKVDSKAHCLLISDASVFDDGNTGSSRNAGSVACPA